MPQPSRTPSTATKSGSAVYVRTDVAGKILDDILRKPGKRGATPPAVQNKRRHIGQGTCTPGAAIVMCLTDNDRLDEFISALRTVMNAGHVSEPITDIARHVTKAERALGEPFEELFSGRASSRDYATMTREAHILEEEAGQLESAAAHVQYVAPARRSA